MSRSLKRLATTLLAIAMLLSILPMATAEQAVETITLYPSAANVSSGVVSGYKGDFFASKGIKLEIWAFSDEKTNAILASGDLPDIMYIPEVNRDVMIEAGMLLNLDDYLDQMPNAVAYEPLATALNYVRAYKSAGTGSVYGLPTTVGDNSTKAAYADSTERNAVKINWEIYEEIGAPEITDVWSLLDVMEQMLAAHPTDKDGNPFYGTILNNGSDSQYWACMTLYYRWFGFMERDLAYMLETDMVNGIYSSILDEGSKYYEGLKWYNQAYRRGLMDPDSINNDRPTQKAKVDAGYAMIPSGYLPGWATTYYQYLLDDSNIHYNYTSTYGGLLIGINANTDKLDACLKFLDTLCDPDAMVAITYGPEGDYWIVDEAGNITLSEKALAYLNSNKQAQDQYTLESGEKLVLWNTPWIVNTGEPTSYGDGEGGKKIIAAQQWKEANEISATSPTFLKWRETTGYSTWSEWLADKDAYCPVSTLDGIFSFCSQPDDIMKLTVDALRDTVVTASWKMVYAQSDEEFQKIWDAMVKDCMGLGAEDVITWRLADIENARVLRDELVAE